MIPSSFVGQTKSNSISKGTSLCFEAVFGLKLKLTKSEVVLVGNVPTVVNLAIFLGCRVSSLHMRYLVYPSGATFKTAGFWDALIEKAGV